MQYSDMHDYQKSIPDYTTKEKEPNSLPGFYQSDGTPIFTFSRSMKIHLKEGSQITIMSNGINSCLRFAGDITFDS